MTLDTLLHAYIDANVVLLFAAVAWGVTCLFVSLSPLRSAYAPQLKLLYSLFLVIGIGVPALLAVVPVSQFAGTRSVNLSDMVVAQYLDGRFIMSPSQFEQLLAFRDTIVHSVASLGSTLGVAIAAVMVLGIALAFGRSMLNLVRLRRLISQSYEWRRFGRLHLRLTDASHIPFSTRGLFNRYVVIPSSMLSQPVDLRIALAHEFQHFRQGDLTWEFLLEFLRPFFVFNPAYGFWKREVERLRELACDQQVLRRHRVAAQDYGACLIRVCLNTQRNIRQHQIAIPSVGLIQGASARGRGRSERVLRHRIKEMLHATSVRGSDWMIATLLLPLTFVVALSAVAVQRSGDWSQDRLMLSTIVNLERLNLRNGFSRP